MVLIQRDHFLRGPGGATRPLTAEEMLAWARSLDLSKLDVSDYRKFQEKCYKRNTVLLNEHMELVVICWLPGQMSAIHDHGRSNCLYVVCEGSMQEELFRLGPDGKPVAERKRRFSRGDVTLAGGKDVHRISNPTDRELVTVHVYSPPLDESAKMYTPIPTARAVD
jgi:cysteine dioxygenase